MLENRRAISRFLTESIPMANDQSPLSKPALMTDKKLIGLSDLGIVDAPASEAYDKFTRLITSVINVPVALVSIVQEELDRQFFTSHIGLEPEWAAMRQTPLSHSFCQLVKRDNRPLIVEDAPEDTRVCDNLAIPDLGVRAYLGVPINDPNGKPMGALCAIDGEPRRWSEQDLAIMTDLAHCVDDQTRLRSALLLHTLTF